MDLYYPIFLNLVDKLCIVVGGGRVAERKIRSLLRARARVRVVCLNVTKGVAQLAVENRIEVICRGYCQGDLEGGTLAFAATDNEKVNRQVQEDASRLSMPVNVADNPNLCDFIVPSLVRKDPVLIALSTSGLLPSLSKKLRQEVIEGIASDYPLYARRVGAFRRYLIGHVDNGRTRKRIMRNIAGVGVAEIVRMTLTEMKERFLGPEGDPPDRPTVSRAVRGSKTEPTRKSRPVNEDSR
jgi:precorrin-2 dehydrogenase/sirohydrochlorin ferrochelatase